MRELRADPSPRHKSLRAATRHRIALGDLLRPLKRPEIAGCIDRAVEFFPSSQ